MGISFVRAPSETPNITNNDDFCGLRYAYGDYNGYVQNKGNSISYTINGSEFTINSGRIVLQGTETDIDANGVTISIDSVATKRYFSVYLEVNVSSNTSVIKSSYDTAGYPTISEGDNLTSNTIGIARLLLYTFEAINGAINNVTKKIEEIPFLKREIHDLEEGNMIVGRADYAETAYTCKNYNTSEGTIKNKFAAIDERLDDLGFKEGSVTLSSGFIATMNEIEKVGLSGKLNIEIQKQNTTTVQDSIRKGDVIATLPSAFCPIEDSYIYCRYYYWTQSISSSQESNLLITANGELKCNWGVDSDEAVPNKCVNRIEIINYYYKVKPI